MDEVEAFYGRSVEAEWRRLDDPFGRLELLSHLTLIDRWVPAGAAVCDIGGGPGRYATELLQRGHHVTLVELTPAFVDAARARCEAMGLPLDQAIHGDARYLSMLDDEAFDAVLVMGPLYHLQDYEDRLRVLAEVRRILRPGGITVLAYLNAWGLMRTGITDFPHQYTDPSFLSSMETERAFEIWWWSTPAAAQVEIAEAGFEVLEYAGLEGFVGGMGPLVRGMAESDPEAYAQVLNAAVRSSTAGPYRDATEHISFVVRR